MKKPTLMILTALSLLLAACGPNPASSGADVENASVTKSAAVSEAPAKTAAPPPAQPGYFIRDTMILSADEKPVYDAARYYEQGWTVWLSGLKEAYGALYFIEGAAFNDGISCICDSAQKGAVHAVVRLGPAGSRSVLASKNTAEGYYGMLPFAERVFFIDSLSETASVCYADKEGKSFGTLSLPADKGFDLIDAKLKAEGEFLIITAVFYSKETDSNLSHTYRADADLNIERLE